MSAKMVMAEFSGRRAGFFRPKPVRKCGKACPRCGEVGHIGRTTCQVKTLAAPNKSAECPRTDAQFNSAVAAAQYAMGQSDQAGAWRNVATEMRDFARMLEREIAERKLLAGDTAGRGKT